jgi:hypothetical protein
MQDMLADEDDFKAHSFPSMLRCTSVRTARVARDGRRAVRRPSSMVRRNRWRIEPAFRRLRAFRRVATRYDERATDIASAVRLAAVIAFWCGSSATDRSGPRARLKVDSGPLVVIDRLAPRGSSQWSTR